MKGYDFVARHNHTLCYRMLQCFRGQKDRDARDDVAKLYQFPSRSTASAMASQVPATARIRNRAISPMMQASIDAPVEEPPKPKFNMKDLAGVTAPFGYFDPVGFCEGETEGRQRFYREVEVKHGRVAMLAALGFPLAEQFHPLFGGDIDVASDFAFQQTPLQDFWGPVVLAIAIPEVFSVFSFNSPAGGQPWSVRSDHTPGDLGFDPLGLKPTDPKELKEMQTKELNNGRLAMLAAAGMIAQELVSGEKLF